MWGLVGRPCLGGRGEKARILVLGTEGAEQFTQYLIKYSPPATVASLEGHFGSALTKASLLVAH